MKERKNSGKLHTFYKRMEPVLVVLIISLWVFLGVSFAKYYSLQKQKGVAVASDFYFSSDILKTGVTMGEGAPSKISPYVAVNAWNPTGTMSTVTFFIRNYANYLLYNDENIQLEYDLYAMVSEEDTSGISYSLAYGDSQEISLSTTPVKISDSLGGGEPLSNAYSINYRYPSGIKSLPKAVYVWAVPTAPSYIPVGTYTIGSAISVRETTAEFVFSGGWKFITLENPDEPLTDKQKETIQEQVGFVYNISTSGSNTQGADKDKVNVALSWNSNYVELDRFSKIYNAAAIVTDENGIKTMNLTINAYTSNDILFYRTKNFDLSVFTTKGDFDALVDAVCTDTNP